VRKEGVGILPGLHNGHFFVRPSRVPQLCERAGISRDDGPPRDPSLSVLGHHHRGDYGVAEHLFAQVVRDSASDHASEGIADNHERLGDDARFYLRLHCFGEILSKCHAAKRTSAVARQVDVHPPPLTSGGKHGVQGEEQPVINSEPVQENQRRAFAPFNDVHRSIIPSGALRCWPAWPQSAGHTGALAQRVCRGIDAEATKRKTSASPPSRPKRSHVPPLSLELATISSTATIDHVIGYHIRLETRT